MTGARWDEDASRWRVETDRGAFSAQVLVSAAGGLTEPKLPAVPGLDSFAGTMFHSARWDHGHDLSGERVGVIGTGSTASQIVPQVQEHAARLTVFQRSPGWVLPRLDHPHSDLQKLLLRRFPVLQRAIRSAIYYNNELLIVGLVRRPRLLAGLERLALGYLKRQVPDAEIRARLTPDYRIGCKRIIISSDFLGTFMKPNVELVTAGIREIVPDGIVTQDGRKIELDTIVFATGFDVMNPPHFRNVVGRGGRSIREVWDEHGIRAYLGTVIPGFPNHFVLLGPNTASGNNSALQPIEAQIGFAIDALRAMDARGATAVDVRGDVMERFDDEIQRRLAPTVWNSGGCHSWYVGPDGRNFTIWPAFANEYKRRLARFDPAEFELTSAPVAVAMG